MSYNTHILDTIPIVLEENGKDVLYNFCRNCIEWIKCSSNKDIEGARKYNHSIKTCKLQHYFKINHGGKPLCGFVLNGKPCPDGKFCKMNHPKNYPIINIKKINIISSVCRFHAVHIIKSTNPCKFGDNCISNHDFTEKFIAGNYCINNIFGLCNRYCSKIHCTKDDLTTLKNYFYAQEFIPMNIVNDPNINSLNDVLSLIDFSLSDSDKFFLKYD